MDQYSLEKLTASARAWLDRSDPRAKALVDNATNENKYSTERWMEMARRAFERECVAEGIDPARGVSPTLLKMLGERNAAQS